MTVIYEHPITEHAKWLKRIEVTYSKIENLIKNGEKIFMKCIMTV